MADNIKVNEGAGPKVATDEVEIDGATAHAQRTKLVWGVAGTAVDASATNPLPIKAESGSQVKVTALEGEPNVKVANEPTVKVAASQTIGIAAGTAEIGKVKVTENAALVAGTAEIGKVKVTELSALVAGTAEIGKVKVTELPATPTGTNSIGKVKSIEEALPAGTNAIGKVTVTSLEGEPKVKVASLEGEPKVKAIGDVASGSADSGNPVKTAAVAQTALPAATTAGNRINSQADKYGRLFVTVAPPDTLVSGKVFLENETSTEVLAAPGENIRLVVTSILVTNSGTTSTRVEILDEATGKLIGYAVKEGGGFSFVNDQGLFIVTANKPVKAKCLTTGSKTDVFISAYKLPA